MAGKRKARRGKRGALLSPVEAAEALGVCVRTVTNYAARGLLTREYVAGRGLHTLTRYRAAQVRALARRIGRAA